VITSWVAAGDSITASSVDVTASSYNTPAWPTNAEFSSGIEVPRINNGTAAAFAVSGYTVEDFNDTIIPLILALNPLPSHCICQYGSNDAGTGVATGSVVQFISGYQTAVDTLRANGIEPIILTTPPAQPYNTTSSVEDAARANRVAQFNEALWDFCIQNQIRLIDNRATENPFAPGESYRGMFREGDNLGLHPQENWHFWVARNVAKTLEAFGSGEDVYRYDAVTQEPDFDTTLPTFTDGTNMTTDADLAVRHDGVGGNLLRVVVENNGTKQLGSGDTGIAFTAATGVDIGAFDVTVWTENYYDGVGGDGLTPAVSVSPIIGTTRKLIVIKPARPATSYASLCTAVINAVNNHPEASALCVAASTGTPGSNVFNPTDRHTLTSCRWETAVPSVDQTVSATDEVRGVIEVWGPPGALPPAVALYGRITGGSGFSSIASVSNVPQATPAPSPTEKYVLTTPWVTIGTKRRFQLRVYFGGAEGLYFFGRPHAQVRTP
jgi:lysophospholipase L1-like esterase